MHVVKSVVKRVVILITSFQFQRLDIVPIVCNVEQVRILRGLGAIQPGVNRCKLLSTKDFDVLFKDCTTAR